MDEDLERGGRPEGLPAPEAAPERAWVPGWGAAGQPGQPGPPGEQATPPMGDEALDPTPPSGSPASPAPTSGPPWWGSAGDASPIGAGAARPFYGQPGTPGPAGSTPPGPPPGAPALGAGPPGVAPALLVPGAERVAADSWAIGDPRSRRGRFRVATWIAAAAVIAGGAGAALGVTFSTAPGAAPPSAGAGPGGTATPPGSSPVGGASGSNAASPRTSGNGSLVKSIANAVDPAVVDIDVENAIVGPAAGTGMIISSSGYVLTNNHVIDDAVTVRVTIAGRAQPATATVVGYDRADDVALLKIEGVSSLPTVHFADSAKVAIGDTVVVIGNALGQGGAPTVESGTVTALDRTITAADAITSGSETLHGLLQTDAQIQSGDSGGPMVDANGAVIGMDTAAAQVETGGTIGFAIPIDRARSIVDQIRAGRAGGSVVLGLSPFMGIMAYPKGEGPGNAGSPFGGLFGPSGSSGATGAAPGVAISSVTPSGPAARAGLQAGDVITAIDGTSTPTFTALHGVIQAHRPGQRVGVTYVDTAGRTEHAEVTLIGIPY